MQAQKESFRKANSDLITLQQVERVKEAEQDRKIEEYAVKKD
jgi:hypothetical protein